MRNHPIVIAGLLLMVPGALLLGDGAWIWAKGWLAQVLLHRAWQRARAGSSRPKPWPWADTWPVARLRVPSLGVDEIVLAGASGRTLAFGPGHVDGTAPPGRPGVCVLSGHRDTHFAFLEKLRAGAEIDLETADGRRTRFRVTSTEVLDRDDTWVLADDGVSDLLTLVTCWPFHAVAPGGPGRFVVWAEEEEPPRASASASAAQYLPPPPPQAEHREVAHG